MPGQHRLGLADGKQEAFPHTFIASVRNLNAGRPPIRLSNHRLWTLCQARSVCTLLRASSRRHFAPPRVALVHRGDCRTPIDWNHPIVSSIYVDRLRMMWLRDKRAVQGGAIAWPATRPNALTRQVTRTRCIHWMTSWITSGRRCGWIQCQRTR